MLTKKDLKDALKNLPTKKDLENTANSLRGEFKEGLQSVRGEFKKEIKSVVEDAATQILDAVTRGFEVVATKDDLKTVKDELKADIKDVQRQINDLKADTPTPQEHRDHEKRINKLEQSVFPS